MLEAPADDERGMVVGISTEAGSGVYTREYPVFTRR